MAEYHKMMHMEEIEPDALDEYLSINEENSINQLDIIHLFGKEKLETIQESLSKATGLAFITVDFKGDPITSATSFSRYCEKVRNNPEAMERCKSSDAFGSIQAAVTQKTNVYFCPCGLLEVAIPIIVQGHYLGGFIGGQIQCNDAPESVSRLSSVMHAARADEAVAEYRPLPEEIPFYSYEKFLDIANLVFLVINQLSENEVSQHLQEDILKKRMKKLQVLNHSYAKEITQINRRIMELEMQSNHYELLDMLTSLLNLTIIEEADRTNELLSSYIDYIKYKYTEKSTFVHISGELEHAEQYLLFQKKKTGDRLEYSIQVPKELHMQKMPSDILMPFIQNAFYNGIMLKKEGGEITVTGYMRNGNVILEINDTGPGLTEDELDIKYEAYKDKHEGYYIKMGMEYAKEKMKRLFGKEYSIITENYRNKGSKSILLWPEHYEERTE
ncbi:MAG: PocR ligand-binding domain-containing protein [Clostridia bacterium]|nr:PocR ligand-binding domain-containing protein [Clostridia bacterium]